MSGWTLWQFERIVDSFLSDCDPIMATMLDAKLDLLAEKGNLAGRPLTGHLREGIFELRAHYRGMQPRLLFYFKSGKRIFFVHALSKKKSQVPKQDLDLAIRRKKMIESGEVTVNAISYIN